MEKTGKKIEIKNSFFDFLAFLLSFFVSFVRSIKGLFIKNKTKKNIFFDFLDFVFRKWTLYFWKKPSLYKVTSLFSNILNSIFNKK